MAEQSGPVSGTDTREALELVDGLRVLQADMQTHGFDDPEHDRLACGDWIARLDHLRHALRAALASSSSQDREAGGADAFPGVTRPGSRARLSLSKAVLVALEAGLEPDTIRGFVESDLRAVAAEYGHPRAVHYSVDAGDGITARVYGAPDPSPESADAIRAVIKAAAEEVTRG